MHNRCYYVYILTNQQRTVLYTGVNNDIKQRVIEHYRSRGLNHSFAGRYHTYFLLYYEPHQYINNAIAREKEIKLMSRQGKMQLIGTFNPTLEFLNKELFGCWPPEELPSRF
jgi:putative endonuclease